MIVESAYPYKQFGSEPFFSPELLIRGDTLLNYNDFILGACNNYKK